MDRTAIDPWQWSLQLGFSQGQLVEGQRRVLICAGQSAVDAEGVPQHAGDLPAQMSLALDNLEAVLAGAGMTLSNIVRVNIYTTDVDGFMQNLRVITERTGAANVLPAATVVGVTRLANPDLLVELEATAMD